MTAFDLPDDAPLTLAEACEQIFHGQIKPSTLRAEARRGRLVIERIGRRDFVKPRAIKEMREKAQLQPSDLVSGSAKRDTEPTASRGRRPGSSSTEASISPRDALKA